MGFGGIIDPWFGLCFLYFVWTVLQKTKDIFPEGA
jgi:hypothetical protein